MKFTRKQLIFVISYPFVHVILSIIFLLMAFLMGVADGQRTIFQKAIITIGSFGITILWAPLFLWKRLGLPVLNQTFGEYLSIFLCGLVYAVIGIVIYKKFYRR